MNFSTQVLSNTINYPSTSINGNKTNLSKTDIAFDDEVKETSFMSKLKEMKEQIDKLEALAEVRENEISQIVSTRNKFIALISHDLRGPFSSIMCALDLLKLKLTRRNIKDIERYVDIATDSANRTLHLLDDLLTWTISQNKENCFRPVMINLHEVISGELKGFKFASMQKRITLCRKVSENLIVKADLQMIKTVIRNLISNAIKFTPNDGIITVSATESKQLIQISVKDNGIGISAADRKSLFDPKKIHSMPGTNSETGVGLGLLLCKEFVEMHGGKIWVEKAGSVGSEFKFNLPKARINKTDIQISQNN
ncbi:MAG: HAMP domain-containing histidine kinase [Bacteroidales bacterium]|nr:HAMP domain-containing histidine kinase [Bacteroidales bacterium]